MSFFTLLGTACGDVGSFTEGLLLDHAQQRKSKATSSSLSRTTVARLAPATDARPPFRLTSRNSLSGGKDIL